MLDLSHPQTEHIFAAGRLEDSVRITARRIIVVSAAERRVLLTQCEETLDKMRTLNLEHFDGSRFISECIDDLQQALHRLAETNQASFDIIAPALTRLSSAEGFQTAFI